MGTVNINSLIPHHLHFDIHSIDRTFENVSGGCSVDVPVYGFLDKTMGQLISAKEQNPSDVIIDGKVYIEDEEYILNITGITDFGSSYGRIAIEGYVKDWIYGNINVYIEVYRDASPNDIEVISLIQLNIDPSIIIFGVNDLNNPTSIYEIRGSFSVSEKYMVSTGITTNYDQIKKWFVDNYLNNNGQPLYERYRNKGSILEDLINSESPRIPTQINTQFKLLDLNNNEMTLRLQGVLNAFNDPYNVVPDLIFDGAWTWTGYNDEIRRFVIRLESDGAKIEQM